MVVPQSPAQVLDSLSQRDLLRCLAWIQIRRNQLDTFHGLLQARLARMVGEPEQEPVGQLLTVPTVAKVLKLGRARAYELVRSGDLPGVRIGERQIRVRRADLAKYLQPQNGRV